MGISRVFGFHKNLNREDINDLENTENICRGFLRAINQQNVQTALQGIKIPSYLISQLELDSDKLFDVLDKLLLDILRTATTLKDGLTKLRKTKLEDIPGSELALHSMKEHLIQASLKINTICQEELDINPKNQIAKKVTEMIEHLNSLLMVWMRRTRKDLTEMENELNRLHAEICG